MKLCGKENNSYQLFTNKERLNHTRHSAKILLLLYKLKQSEKLESYEPFSAKMFPEGSTSDKNMNANFNPNEPGPATEK